MSAFVRRSGWVAAAAMVALAFGLLTIKEGGAVLFVDGEARRAAGYYVPFVVWFNFLAGFGYLIAGGGLWRRRRWAPALSAALAVATLLVFQAFGLHILHGGAYEARTVAALAFRAGFWIVMTVIGYRAVVVHRL